MGTKIRFSDRDDLVDKLIIKKKDIPNSAKFIEDLASSLKRYKRGDKEAMNHVIKLRKKVLAANAELYIELDEDKMHDSILAQINVLDLIEEDED